MKLHKSLTYKVIADAVVRHRTSLDDPGFCTECGFEVGGVEPDARQYPCESCGENTVYGAEELLLEF